MATNQLFHHWQVNLTMQLLVTPLLAKDIDTIWIDAIPSRMAVLVARDAHLEGVLAWC